MSNRWQESDAPRGEDYDARWVRLAQSGESIHGEADLVEDLMRDSGGRRVLDAGCGTGRVAIELARRGYAVVGVDADPAMLAAATSKAPLLDWEVADLAELATTYDGGFDAVVLAGNVMIFVDPGSEAEVLGRLTAALAPGGLLIAGFGVHPGRLPLAKYDSLCSATGLAPVARWATWDRRPFGGGDYAVSVHRLGVRT